LSEIKEGIQQFRQTLTPEVLYVADT